MERNLGVNELETIVEQMGQHVRTHAEMHRLTEEVRRYMNEELYMASDDDFDGDVLNQSLFASLSIDPAAQFLRRQEIAQEAIQSPIVSRRRRGKFSEYENIEFPDEHQEDEDLTECPEARALIGQAYESIGRIYNTCRGVAQVIESLSSDGDQTVFDEEVADEDQEDIASSISVPTSSQIPTSAPTKIIVDPSVRPVLSPKPGRAPYKFDPVTRYHLYKEEWDRHPAPGEMRRLSLRWKVREYMLRHDVPRLTANPGGKAEHEKDWSPRPYMD